MEIPDTYKQEIKELYCKLSTKFASDQRSLNQAIQSKLQTYMI